MRIGPLLAVAAVVLFIGFEMHAIGRNSYRTERDFVFQQFVGAETAVSVCGGGDNNQHERFERNLVAVRHRALELIQTNQPALDEAGQLVVLQELESTELTSVQNLIDSKGCADIEVWKLQKRFENLARLNLR